MLNVLGFMVGGLLNFMAAGVGELYRLLGLRSIATLIYNQGTASRLGPFSPAAWAGITRYTELFTAVAWLLLVAVAIVAGLVLSGQGDSRSWQRFSSIMWRMLFAGLLLPFNVLIAENLFQLNNAVVRTIAGMLPAGAMRVLSGVPAAAGISNAFIAGLVQFMLQFETLFFNLLYLERMLVIAALVAIGPLAAWAWVWQQRGTAWGLWFTELTGNILLQAAHAIVIAVTWGILAAGTLSWWQYAVAIGFAIPVGGLVRRMITGFFELIGLREEAAAAGMLGGLLGAGTAITGAGARVAGAAGRAGGGGGGGRPGSPPVPLPGGAGPTAPGGPVFAGGLGGAASGADPPQPVFGGAGAALQPSRPAFGPDLAEAGRQAPAGAGSAFGAPAGAAGGSIHPLERAADAGGRWGRSIGGATGRVIGAIAAAPVGVAFGGKAGGDMMTAAARAGGWLGGRYGGGLLSLAGAAVGAGAFPRASLRPGQGGAQAAVGAGGSLLHHAFGYRAGDLSWPALAQRLKVDDMPRWRSHTGGGGR